MRHPVQLAANYSGVPPTCRLARGVALASLGFLVWLACASAPQPPSAIAREEPAAFIVQATDLATALEAVREVGGEVTHQLAVIRAVGARLTPSQRAELEARAGITRVWEDRAVNLQAMPPSPPTQGAKQLEAGE